MKVNSNIAYYVSEGCISNNISPFFNLSLFSIDSLAPTKTYVKLCTLNACSILNKLLRVCELVCENDVDLAAITETRLNDNDHINVGAGLGFVHRPRSKVDRTGGGRGGGTGLLYKDEILVVQQGGASENRSFEFDCYLISDGSFQLKLINIYRPPKLSTCVFLAVFKKFLNEHLLGDIPVIITGDFNIHVDTDKHESKKFKKLLNLHSCTQHVNFATQKVGGHSLDLVISRDLDNIIVGRPWPVYWPDPPPRPLSDHYPVMCLLRAPTGIL